MLVLPSRTTRFLVFATRGITCSFSCKRNTKLKATFAVWIIISHYWFILYLTYSFTYFHNFQCLLAARTICCPKYFQCCGLAPPQNHLLGHIWWFSDANHSMLGKTWKWLRNFNWKFYNFVIFLKSFKPNHLPPPKRLSCLNPPWLSSIII